MQERHFGDQSVGGKTLMLRGDCGFSKRLGGVADGLDVSWQLELA
ncbi:hypothetical protein [Bosea sp. LC85]|nr:hypothetical protein [Bosea sp. LC85]